MRTTVTLDPDVERMLKNEAHRRGESFKVALNEAVRMAFRSKRNSEVKRKPFVVKARAMGFNPGLDPVKMNKLADDMEIDAFLALTKQMKEKKR